MASASPSISIWRSSLAQMAKKTVNILFCSVGRRVELLRAFRYAYESLDLKGNIIALDVDPLAPALQVADRPYIVPGLDEPGFIPALLEICRSEAVDLVFPLTDQDIPVLAQNKALIEAIGTRVAVVSPEAVAIMTDKWLTAGFFQELGLATPGSWLLGQLDDPDLAFPLSIKSRRGVGHKTYRVRDGYELGFFIDYVPDPIIQEWLPGPEITNDVICDLDGNLLTVVSRQSIEVRWGEVTKGVTIHDPAITEACACIARALPAVGPITVHCLMKDGRPHFTEIKARLGAGVTLGIAAGADSPRWLLAYAAGLDEPISPLGAYEKDLYLTRCAESFFIGGQERQRLAAQPILR